MITVTSGRSGTESMPPRAPTRALCALGLLLITAAAPPGGRTARAADPPVALDDGQALAANAARVIEAFRILGFPLVFRDPATVHAAIRAQDAAELQRLLDPFALCVVEINPEARVKARRGPGEAALQQAGYLPFLIKVINQSQARASLRIQSPQGGQVYGGMTALSAQRMQRVQFAETADPRGDPARFLDVVLHTQPPLTGELSGADVEYALALIYSRDVGTKEATLAFDIGGGTQDLGFRAEVPILFRIEPAVRVALRVRDADGSPTTARLVFRDAAGRVYPPQAKRLAPDFYFQEQIYRRDGEFVLLPPGPLVMESSRGPEYVVERSEITVPRRSRHRLEVRLRRWIDPMAHGFYSGDHHIHGAGCAHYTAPSEGVTPRDMFLNVQGEGLNVGCVLTWGPCFDYQRRFFSPQVNELSEPLTLLKYDLEISGFGSQALGHVCLLDLRDQTYPGSDGTKEKGWPTWTTPVMRWAKAQGGVAGYAHSASGLQIDSAKASRRLLTLFDHSGDQLLDRREAEAALLPERFEAIDADRDQALDPAELMAAHQRAADRLPNLAIPEMDSVGAMEICVSTALGACDFISAMDTARIPEWNMWYHLLNCGFPLKVSGETDFPCMSGSRVGQGRVYVRLGQVLKLDFTEWCRGLAEGRSYVSDGFAHALEFSVNGHAPGPHPVSMPSGGTVEVRARVAFAPQTPRTVAQGLIVPPGGRRFVGDSVTWHGAPTEAVESGGVRLVEIVVNGQPAAWAEIPADGAIHSLRFEVAVEKSSWIALRQFPQLHTNPVEVRVAEKPIRASAASPRWCIETIRQLWRMRGEQIAPAERAEARRAFDEAIARFEAIQSEALAN